MNRNVLTEPDVRRSPLEGGLATPADATIDDYWTRLLKFVPVEVIGAYIIIAGIVDTAYREDTTALRVSLTMLTLFGLVAAWFFSQRVLKVVRTSQLLMTLLAFGLWVFAIGGPFATLAWWAPWMGTVAVVAFGVAVRIVGIGPLPNNN